jgi:hypothetical protein
MLSKIEKAVAKLYFALGENSILKSFNVDDSAFFVEHLAFISLHGTGERIGLKYFNLGISSRNRQNVKPPRGKRKSSPDSADAQPPRGKTTAPVKPGKRLPPKGKKYRADDDFDDEEEDFDDGY